MKRSQLDHMVKRLNERLNRPKTSAHLAEGNKYTQNPGHLYLDHNTHYGGYRLEQMLDKGCGGFAHNNGTEARMSNQEISAYLRGIHDALDATEGQNNV